MLETYPQENMNTQAIRELTDEVFALKNKNVSNDTIISQLTAIINSIESSLINIQEVNVIKSITVAANSRSAVIDWTYPEGINELKAAYVARSLTESSLSMLIPMHFYVENANKRVRLMFFNPTNETVTVNSLTLIIFI